jgi:HSP20 family protein
MSGRAARPPRGEGVPRPWDPLRDLLDLKQRLNRLLESVLRRGDVSSAGVAGWTPPVDVVEVRGTFVLTTDVPGVKRDDLSVRVEGGIVTLEGRRPLEREARSALRVERPYGSFSRTVHLPHPVDERLVSAQLRQGVLQVVLPKSAGVRPTSIRVEVQT